LVSLSEDDERVRRLRAAYAAIGRGDIDGALEAGERVVVLLRARGRPAGGGEIVEAAFADVVTIVEGRLLRIEAYLDHDAALRSVTPGSQSVG
jgi:ketosteroid isomerase-like protein